MQGENEKFCMRSVMSGEHRDCFPAEHGISLLAMIFGLVFASAAKQSPGRN